MSETEQIKKVFEEIKKLTQKEQHRIFILTNTLIQEEIKKQFEVFEE